MSELRTYFKRVDYDLAGLLHYLDIGDIGLPDIQRPFIWSNAKVRFCDIRSAPESTEGASGKV